MSNIPGITLAALNAIQDENARIVLTELTQGWMIRNAGTALPQDNAFVTRGELTGVLGSDSGQGARGIWPQITDVFSVVGGVQADVASSPEFQDLVGRVGVIRVDLDATGSRVDTEITDRTNADTAIRTEITTQVSGLVNGPIATLQQAQTTTANTVSALSQSVTTLQATVGDNSSALQIESQARVDADNSLFAKYSVKIDQNGHVSGYGLMSEANNSTPFASFVVRADRFAISNQTTAGGANVRVPFVVENDLVYIDQAVINKLSAGVVDVQKLSGQSFSYTSAGNFQVMVPDGYTTVKLTLRAGGGGAGVQVPQSGAQGGGGGQGGLAIYVISNVPAGSIINVTVGGGGAGAPMYGAYPSGPGTTAAAGGTTSATVLGTTYTASGGQPGSNAYTNGLSGTPGTGGAGGAGGGSGANGANGQNGGTQNAGGAGGGNGQGAGAGGNASQGAGVTGSALIEAYNPNGVVLRSEWSTLIGHLTSRSPTSSYTWP